MPNEIIASRPARGYQAPRLQRAQRLKDIAADDKGVSVEVEVK